MAYYVLNTNKKTNERFTAEMLAEHKASGYSKGWREKIERLKRDDIVFLYENKVGIVAYGIADGKLKKKECDKKEDEEYYMNLEEFKVLKLPMAASKMRRLSDRSPAFRQMLYLLDAEVGERFVREINKNHIIHDK